MYFSSDSPIVKLLDEIYRFTKQKEEMFAIVCGIKDEDTMEFTGRVRKIKSNNLEDLLETFIDFRNEKQYENDDIDDDDIY